MTENVHPLIAFSNRTGKSITSIAKDAGCSRMTLYRIMNGGNTTTDQLKRISAATGGAVTVGALLEASSNVFGQPQEAAE